MTDTELRVIITGLKRGGYTAIEVKQYFREKQIEVAWLKIQAIFNSITGE